MPSQSSKIVIVIDSNSQGAVSGLNKTQKAIKGVQTATKGASSTASQFGSALNLLLTPITNLGVGLRQIGQALQGVSFLATAFVTIPLVAAFKGAADAAVEFDAALVGAQKTAGLMDSEVGRLSNTTGTLSAGLRSMAQSVATPLEELGKLAEQAGQLGVDGVEDILKFVRVAEILGQTTEISAGEAIETFGRLTQALGVETEDSASYMLQLANAINYLENTTTASAKDIADGMRNAISAAAGFNIAGADLAAFTATMFQMGVGALESGTMFSRMAGYITTKTEDLAELVGKSTGEIRDAFDDDFVGGLLGVLEAIGKVESESEQMAIANDIFGQRAARGVTLLANQFEERLIPNIKAAREEFQNGTSIIDEYVQAMSSTQAQIALLQNNLKVLGVTLGDTFLPIVNTMLQYVVPAVQMVTELFANLTQEWRIGILAGAAFLAIIGPLTLILGSLAFSIGIAISGIQNFAMAFTGVGASLFPVVAIIAAVGTAILGLSFIAEDAMVAIRDTFKGYADSARTWGNNLVGSFAAGMLDGIASVINAAIAVANAIAQFFASFSPPKKGPLSQITIWGKNLIDSYIAGFKKADFSAIEDVTSLIGRYFKDLGKLGLMDEADIVPGILDIRHAFVDLIKIFEETGKVSQKILDEVASATGDLGKETAKYLELLVRTSAAQGTYDGEISKLEEIRDLREEINGTYDKQVKAITKSGKPLLQQLSAIVDARYARDESLDNLDEEESVQESVVDSAEVKLNLLKDQLGVQESLLDFHLDELDLLAEQESLMNKSASATAKAAKAAGEFANALNGINLSGAGGIGKFSEVIGDWDDLISGIDVSVEKFENGRRAIEAFFAGLRGEYISDNPELAANISPEVVGAIKFGRDIRGTFDAVKLEIDKFIDGVKEGILGLGKTMDESDIGEKMKNAFDPIKENAGSIIGIVTAITLFVLGMANLTKIVSFVWLAMDSIGAFSATLTEFGLVLKLVVAGFAPFVVGIAIIAILIGAFVTAIIENLTWFKNMAVTAFEAVADTAEAAGLKEALAGLGAAFADLWSVVSPILYGLWRLVVFVMTVIVQAVTTAIAAALPGLITLVTGIVNVLAGVIGFFANVLKAVWALITGDIEGFNKYALAAVSAAWTSILGVFQIVGGAIVSALGFVFGSAIQIMASIFNALVGGADVTLEKVIEGFSKMAVGMNGWMTQAKDWVIEKATALWDFLGGVLQILGLDFDNIDKKAALAAQGVGGSLSRLEDDAAHAELGIIRPLDGISLGLGALDSDAADAASNIGGSMLDLGNSASGMEGLFGGAFSGIFGTLQTLETDTSNATVGISQNLDGVGEAWGTYETSGVTSASNVTTSIGDLDAVMGTFKSVSLESLSELGLGWDTLGADVHTDQIDMSGYLDTLDVDTGVLRDNTDTASTDMVTSWDSLDLTIMTVVGNITGEGGYYETLATETEKLREGFVAAFYDMELGVLDFEETIDRVLGEINSMVQDMLQDFRDLQDEIVGHSIIPDMNDAIIESFEGMISQTSNAVGSWVGSMIGQVSAFDGASANMSLSAPDDAGAFTSTGPLVEIRQIVVPNQQVGQAFAKSIAEEIGSLVTYRRVPG